MVTTGTRAFMQLVAAIKSRYFILSDSGLGVNSHQHVQKLWTSMHNSAYDCDKKNLIAPLMYRCR